jgi:hypothetical protein
MAIEGGVSMNSMSFNGTSHMCSDAAAETMCRSGC